MVAVAKQRHWMNEKRKIKRVVLEEGGDGGFELGNKD